MSPLEIIGFLVFLAIVAVVLKRFADLDTQRQEISQAPTFEELVAQAATARRLGDAAASRDRGWVDQPASSFKQPPTAILVASRMKCYAWRTFLGEDGEAWTMLVRIDDRRHAWTFTFQNDRLLRACMGPFRATRFREADFTRKELYDLSQFHLGVILTIRS